MSDDTLIMDDKWWHDHDKLMTLLCWMRDHNESAANIVDAVEKPWKFTYEYEVAAAEESGDEVAIARARKALEQNT